MTRRRKTDIPRLRSTTRRATRNDNLGQNNNLNRTVTKRGGGITGGEKGIKTKNPGKPCGLLGSRVSFADRSNAWHNCFASGRTRRVSFLADLFPTRTAGGRNSSWRAPLRAAFGDGPTCFGKVRRGAGLCRSLPGWLNREVNLLGALPCGPLSSGSTSQVNSIGGKVLAGFGQSLVAFRWGFNNSDITMVARIVS